MQAYKVQYQNADKRVGYTYSKTVKADSAQQAEAIIEALYPAAAIVLVTAI